MHVQEKGVRKKVPIPMNMHFFGHCVIRQKKEIVHI